MNESIANSRNQKCPLDALVNKTVDFAYRGAKLKFDLSHALFSSYDIDAGTRLLLKEIAHEPGIVDAHRVLDAGCGAGVLGISLAASCPDMDVVMHDRDFRAVAFSHRNAKRNGLSSTMFDPDGNELIPCETHRFAKVKVAARPRASILVEPALIGEEDARGPYDAVVANLPAKAGAKLLSRYFRDISKNLLNPGGFFAFVIVTPLAESALQWCKNEDLEMIRKISTKNHLVCITQTSERTAIREARAPSGSTRVDTPHWLASYIRSHAKCTIANATLEWDGIQGLPEFNEPSYATVCMLTLAQKALAGQLVRRALIIEPGVGIVPLWIGKVLGSSEIILRSHDFLALSASLHNVHSLNRGDVLKTRCMLEPPFCGTDDRSRGKMDIVERVEDWSVDAILITLEEIPGFDNAEYYWPLVESVLKRGGVFIVAGTSNQIERIARQKLSGFSRLHGSERKKGWESIAFRRD